MITLGYNSIRDSVENHSKKEFTSVADAQKHVREEFRTLTCYWQVWIYRDGVKVLRGYRSGYNATGKRWIWEEVTS